MYVCMYICIYLYIYIYILMYNCINVSMYNCDIKKQNDGGNKYF